MKVRLRRREPGRYEVIFGEIFVERPPIEVVRQRSTRESRAWGHYHGHTVVEQFWGVEWSGWAKLDVIAEWKRRITDHDWLVGSQGAGFETLRDAREALSALDVREKVAVPGSPDHEEAGDAGKGGTG